MYVYGWNHRNLTWTSIQIWDYWAYPIYICGIFPHLRSTLYCLKPSNMTKCTPVSRFFVKQRKHQSKYLTKETEFQKNFDRKIFQKCFYPKKKLKRTWSHELIEKLDFYVFFHPHDDFLGYISWNSHFRVIIKQTLFLVYEYF